MTTVMTSCWRLKLTTLKFQKRKQTGCMRKLKSLWLKTRNKYEHRLSDKVHVMIQKVIKENDVGFKLQDFQLLTLHCLGILKNVLLV